MSFLLSRSSKSRRMRSRSSSAFTSPIRFDMPRTISVPDSPPAPDQVATPAAMTRSVELVDLAPALLALPLAARRAPRQACARGNARSDSSPPRSAPRSAGRAESR